MWIELLNDHRKITKIFEIEPVLKNVAITKVELLSFQNSVKVTVNLNEFPETPPKKWIQAKANTVTVDFLIDIISDFKITNWNGNHKVDIIFEGIRNENIVTRIIGEDFLLTCRGMFIDIVRISACQDTLRE